MSDSQENKTSFMGTYFDRSIVLRIVRVAEIASWVVLVVYALQLMISALSLILQYVRGFMPGMGFTDMFQQWLFVWNNPSAGLSTSLACKPLPRSC